MTEDESTLTPACCAGRRAGEKKRSQEVLVVTKRYRQNASRAADMNGRWKEIGKKGLIKGKMMIKKRSKERPRRNQVLVQKEAREEV